MALRLQRCLGSMLFAVAGLAVGASLVIATAPGAHAAFILELSSGSTTVAVVDGGVGDVDADSGEIKFSGNVGMFVITLTTGRSKPSLGSAMEPEMQLKSVDVSSSLSGGSLTIKLTDTDFTAEGLTHWVASVAGATSGSLSFEAYIGTDNAEFSTDAIVADFNPLTGVFVESVSSQAIVVPPFSLTLIATITHGAGIQGTAFSANVKDPNPTPVSEPGSLVLFGTGLLGLGLLARRWPKKWLTGGNLH